MPARLAQLVEHHIDIVGVTGSSPVSRTRRKTPEKGVFLSRVRDTGLERFSI